MDGLDWTGSLQLLRSTRLSCVLIALAAGVELDCSCFAVERKKAHE